MPRRSLSIRAPGKTVAKKLNLKRTETVEIIRRVRRDMTSTDYKAEELRGVFAIGAVASVGAFKNEIHALPFGYVLIVLAVCWSAYVFFMAIGISKDILPPALAFVAAPSIEVAHLSFFGGMVLSAILPAMALISALRFVRLQQLAALTAVFLIVCLCFLRRHYSRNRLMSTRCLSQRPRPKVTRPNR